MMKKNTHNKETEEWREGKVHKQIHTMFAWLQDYFEIPPVRKYNAHFRLDDFFVAVSILLLPSCFFSPLDSIDITAI